MTAEKEIKFRKLLEDLYLIAELKPYKTISTKTISIVNHTKLSSWYRWWNKEDRFKSLEWIYKVFEKTKEMIKELDDIEKKSLILALKNTKEGISTLLITYQEDADICSKINTLLSEIHIFISKEEPIFIPNWLKNSPKILHKLQDNLD